MTAVLHHTAPIRTAPIRVRGVAAAAAPALGFDRCSSESHRQTDAIYRRRRAVAGTLLAVLAAVSIVLAHDVLAGSGGVPASAAASQPAHTRSSTVAQPGDTLWSIAEERHGAVAIGRYVDKLVDLNGGASIQAGQTVVLP